jgi:hypothetical protein
MKAQVALGQLIQPAESIMVSWTVLSHNSRQKGGNMSGKRKTEELIMHLAGPRCFYGNGR